MGLVHIAWVGQLNRLGFLATESVQGPALPLQSIDDVHGSDGLPLGMLSVGDGVADDVLQEHLHAHQLHKPQQKRCSPSIHLWSLHR